MLNNIIEIKPYLQFIRLEYEIEDEEFLALHPKLKKMRNFLYERREDYFRKDALKLIERLDNEKVK